MEEILKIAEFMFDSFLHIWPYLVISIPLAVLINMSGASKYIHKAVNNKPFVSIILATAVGAISPFCSCGVIPVITSLLIGGVPLAPVMSFWIASPSMDPEIFLLSTASIGWELSLWRLVATLIISLSAGFVTALVQKNGFFSKGILRSNQPASNGPSAKLAVQLIGISEQPGQDTRLKCCIPAVNPDKQIKETGDCRCNVSADNVANPFPKHLIAESWKAFFMVSKFMMLAFLINALMKFYVPEHFISNFIANDNPFSVLIAAAVGIPFYTSNITALPLVSGLLSMGMNQGAVLAFLIAGPVTTLPAMMAVWGIVRPRVFMMYLSFGLLGSVIFGYLYNLMML
jgi:uncharacterized protein